MSVFSNPASSAPEHAAAYVAAILGLLGDTRATDVLRSTPEHVESLLGKASPDQIGQPESAGKWSMGEVVQHLADSELVFSFRLRMVLAHDRPQLMGYDQDLWASRLRYSESDWKEALALFAVVRRANVRLVERASRADLQRVSVHVERGEESVEHMIKLYAGHDLLHIRQLERILTHF